MPIQSHSLHFVSLSLVTPSDVPRMRHTTLLTSIISPIPPPTTSADLTETTLASVIAGISSTSKSVAQADGPPINGPMLNTKATTMARPLRESANFISSPHSALDVPFLATSFTPATISALPILTSTSPISPSPMSVSALPMSTPLTSAPLVSTSSVSASPVSTSPVPTIVPGSADRGQIFRSFSPSLL
ncbi:hypothetical protein P691DRAFT_757688 [Macrolepiota fuliginosa MF-IS2]|uniref:Uncharacterized protein n=1 Tax=Macrolepiota fuliginosa MF-IS2 TaxID=1400762 RepID=A0A9P6C3R8_9AGAR|nr:hypothetical protein P691DRAFT_757688 [Macrolepiota fuliginosa MF-IS2]